MLRNNSTVLYLDHSILHSSTRQCDDRDQIIISFSIGI
jgi:hypothetical protein